MPVPHAATPPRLVISWTADGTDYVSLGSGAELDFDHAWPVLQGILGEAEAQVPVVETRTRVVIVRHHLERWRSSNSSGSRRR